MYKNYFKTAWRNLLNNKGYSLLNIFGLATGMAVALIIGLWAYHQYSYDRFLPDSDRLYQVNRNFNSNGETLTFKTTSLPLADALRSEIPEIEYVAETDWMGSHGLMVGEKKIYLNGGQTGEHFLEMFCFPLIEGSATTVFKDPYSIVLTQSTATSLFGSQDAMNKTVRIDNKNDLKVTGIMKDLPENSTFRFRYLVPFSYFEQTENWVKQNRSGSFSGNAYQIFVKLRPGVSYTQVAPKIKDITKRDKGNTNAQLSDVILQPMTRWHLYTYKNGVDKGGFIEYVQMFSIIGSLVLLIACINFINLTTARSEKRAREVGVRKAIGSRRKDLVMQFLLESVLLTLFAGIVSVIMVQAALPVFNELTGAAIQVPYGSGWFWLVLVAGILVTALLAGGRPAFYLSGFQPVKVLKGTLQVGKAASLPRKILVVIQFTGSIALIISTIIIYRQIQHAKERPLGYSLNRLVMTNTNSDIDRNYAAIKQEMLEQRLATSVTKASSPATAIYWHTDLDNWPGKHPGETVEMGTITVSENYFETLGMTFAEGRNFSSNSDTTSVIFNEAAINRMRIKDPVNKVISFNDAQLQIKGVVKDALMLSPFSAADPTMFACMPGTESVMMYQLSPTISTQDAIAKLGVIFNKYNPAFPYSYDFADTSYEDKFKLELLIGKLAGIFAALAIFISCLGLFGLAAYTAEQRTKEIGVRKVLGASVFQLWVLLSTDFMWLVFISCLIASPVALYFLHNWLQQYPYRVTLGAGVFFIAALMAITITLITVSYQAISAALMNPVKSLRSE